MSETTVSVVGLGKLGMCIAACFAKKRFRVVGVDTDSSKVDAVNRGESSIVEPGLAEMLAEVSGSLEATTDVERAVAETDCTFVVVPTPSDENGAFSLEFVRRAIRDVGRSVRTKRGYHLVALGSTVLPGSTQFGLLPLLEEESGKHCSDGFGFCYSPEFVALGSVIRDFLNPGFVLIGESDDRAGSELAGVYRRVCDNDPSIVRTSFVNAELIKIAVNTYVTMKITFGNMLAAICEEVPGADIDVVTAALGMDARIGPRCLKGGLGYGGPCFPRDNVALAYFARRVGRPALVAEAVDHYNRNIVDRLVSEIAPCLNDGSTVAVLGMAYKPGTNVVEESQALELAARLAEKGISVVVFDPLAMTSARSVLGFSVTYAAFLRDALAGADFVILASPDLDSSQLEAELARLKKRPMIMDVWREFGPERARRADVAYRAIGVGRKSTDNLSRLEHMWARRRSTDTTNA